jgi:predicted Zn finger-like uncharacterized protein
MQIKCPECNSAYRIDDSKIPDKGTQVKCPKCRSSIFLSKEEKYRQGGSPVEKDEHQMKICPWCKYQREPKDDQFFDPSECPKCGSIYEKAKAVSREREKREPEEKSRETLRQKTTAIRDPKSEMASSDDQKGKTILTSEERQKIYEEEKARIEAQGKPNQKSSEKSSLRTWINEHKAAVALVVAITLGLSLWYAESNNIPAVHERSETVRSKQASSYRNSTAMSRSKWYEGGTLHRATVSQWKRSAYSNKLATAADWAANLPRIKAEVTRSGNIETLRPFASNLVVCVDEAAAGEGYGSMSVAELAAGCAILMGWN